MKIIILITCYLILIKNNGRDDNATSGERVIDDVIILITISFIILPRVRHTRVYVSASSRSIDSFCLSTYYILSSSLLSD